MSGYKCPAAKAKCADGLQCVPKKKQCDGVPQCNDGSDESKEVCPGLDTTFLLFSSAAEVRTRNLSHGCQMIYASAVPAPLKHYPTIDLSPIIKPDHHNPGGLRPLLGNLGAVFGP